MSQANRQILVVDDEAPQRELLGDFVRSLGYQVVAEASGEAALQRIASQPPDMVLLDVRLGGISGLETLRRIRETQPDLPVLLVTGFADVRQAVEAVKCGADDYLSKPVDLDELQAAISDSLGRTSAVDGDPQFPELPPGTIADSAAMRSLIRTAALVANSDAPVLVTGESGTGKEVIAHLIHRWSNRANEPLIAANCAGLPESLIESELFGHVKGAFTGAATERKGYFRAAQGGTLFLDEIGDLPIHLQPKLLRALESKQVTPVGAERPIAIDVRLIAATNRDLEQAVQDNTFREDLYYRLNVVELSVPPLRDRREDIPALIRHLASEFVGTSVRLSPRALNCLLAYEWPGNVRELRNAVQRACLLCRGDVVMPEHLPAKIQSLAVDEDDHEHGRLSQVERATILATLDECNGNRTQAARKLGISRRGLIYKLRAMDQED